MVRTPENDLRGKGQQRAGIEGLVVAQEENISYSFRLKNGGDAPPRKECAPLWQQRVAEAFDRVELVILVGGWSQGWHLAGRARPSLTATVAAWRDYLPRHFPLPHPSWRNPGWLNRNPWFAAEALPELRRRVAILLSGGSYQVRR